jgi:hypothetical protein
VLWAGGQGRAWAQLQWRAVPPSGRGVLMRLYPKACPRTTLTPGPARPRPVPAPPVVHSRHPSHPKARWMHHPGLDDICNCGRHVNFCNCGRHVQRSGVAAARSTAATSTPARRLSCPWGRLTIMEASTYIVYSSPALVTAAATRHPCRLRTRPAPPSTPSTPPRRRMYGNGAHPTHAAPLLGPTGPKRQPFCTVAHTAAKGEPCPGRVGRRVRNRARTSSAPCLIHRGAGIRPCVKPHACGRTELPCTQLCGEWAVLFANRQPNRLRLNATAASVRHPSSQATKRHSASAPREGRRQSSAFISAAECIPGKRE